MENRHIRKFEELSPDKYRTAGERFKYKRFKTKKGAELIDWADKNEFGFYNMSGAISGRTDKIDGLTFTRPFAEFLFGRRDRSYQDADDLVAAWKEGKSLLCFTVSFGFRPTQDTLQKLRYDNESFYSPMPGLPMFSFEVVLSKWEEGLEEWNAEAEPGEEHGTYQMFEWSFDPHIYLSAPKEVKAVNFPKSYCIFSDRASALKFRRELPRLLDPFESDIMDIISIVGGSAQDYQRVMSLFQKVSINGIYDAELPANLGLTTLRQRWFHNHPLA